MSLRLARAEEAIGWELLIEEWVRHIQATKKPKTHKSYRNQLSLFQRWVVTLDPPVDVNEFRPTHLDAYLNFRAENGVGDLTRSYDAKLIRMMLDYAYQHEHINRRTLRDYRVRKVPAKAQYCPTVDDMQRFLDTVVNRWDPVKNPPIKNVNAKERRFLKYRDMAIFTGLLDTACRINEMLALNLDDIDVERMQFVLDDTKSNEPRTVPFTERWLTQLQAWRRVRPKCESERLFISSYGDDLNPNQLSRSFRIYRDLAKLPLAIHLHSLRHYALTALAEVDVLAAQAIAGHRDLRTTMIYVHVQQKRNARIQIEADPLGKILINNRTEAQKKARRKLL